MKAFFWLEDKPTRRANRLIHVYEGGNHVGVITRRDKKNWKPAGTYKRNTAKYSQERLF